jgi:diguanylate cyclase (GGDEF)-like protein
MIGVRAAARPIRRLIASIFVVVFCFCALCAYLVWEARLATFIRAEEVGTSLVNAIRSDVARNIEIVDLSLQSIVEDVQRPEIEQADSQIRKLLLFGHSAAVPGIDRLFVLDESGNVRFDSLENNPRSKNLADRDFFIVHKGLTPVGLYVSKPSQSDMSGLWSFYLSRRLSYADGSFAGVAVARIKLSYFERLFRNLELGPDNIATLLRTDGMILMRWPYDTKYIGLNLKSTKLFGHLAESYEGSYQSVSPADGVDRLVVYSRIGDLPLVVIVGQSNSFIYAQWYYFAFLTALVLSVLFMGTVVLSMYLASELTRRHEAESKLADLAATDSLTGLSNRRHFKEAMGHEWHRAMRDLTPLAMLMIDTDKFKAYNDTHGHQAGDQLLKAISTAISTGAGREGDIAARYGGDEFAVLLPSTSTDGAKMVAERVHAALADLCERLGIIQSGLSIGVASLTPAADEQPSMLVELADKALYRAKALGRNRTEVATRPVVEPAIALVPAGTKAA